MRELADSGIASEVPPPGPPTDYLAPAPQTLRGPWSSPTDFPVSVCIPGYELLGELGRGGMGVVYKARHINLNRLVALKVLIGGVFASPADKARFRLEAESVARLHHPNVVQVYDVGEHGGISYIAFEFVDGPTLRRWQKGRAVNPEYAAHIAAHIARAVQHAHEARIVHRDLKPANILLSAVGETRSDEPKADGEGDGEASRSALPYSALVPKVTDFGLAKPLEGGADLTASGIACGTPNYMAPEQVRAGPGGAAPSVDIWGVGTILFEMLTGRPPFVGTDAASIMNDILLFDPPPVTQLMPAVPRDLAVIVAKCLEKDPARRYLSAADLANDLERFLRGDAILARPIHFARRVSRWVGRNPLEAGLVGTLVLGLVGVSAFAVALLRSVEREHTARAQEAHLRKQANDATAAAEAARDQTRIALARTEEALGAARDQKGRAEAEKTRAEENFAIARNAVKHVVAVIRSTPCDDRADHLPLFRDLLVGVEPALAEFLNQKAGDPELRYEQAILARDLGAIEGDLGRFAEAREYFLRSATLLRGLIEEGPVELAYHRTLGYSLAMAGAVSHDLGKPDAAMLLEEGLSELQYYTARRPEDPEGIESLIRVHLAMSKADGDDATDEHARAVLELLDRQERLIGHRPRLKQTRAHALNNIASLLTNRGKTDEAEMYWVEVLALREGLARTMPHDRVAQFELGKCLFNYANQLEKTERPDAAFSARERAAKIFDPLRADARVRTMYIPAIVRNDFCLAAEYRRCDQLTQAIDRLNLAIDLNALLIERTPTAISLRAAHADAYTARAELTERLGRHDQAAGDYRHAVRFSTRQSHREYCSARLVCALVRAGNRAEAVAVAEKLDPESFSHPFPCVELARGWMLIARFSATDSKLPKTQRDALIATAHERARAAILAAHQKGMFRTPAAIRALHQSKDFAPLGTILPQSTD